MKTLTVDDYQRVRLPDVEPRTKFAQEEDGRGRITLRKLQPTQGPPAKVRFLRRNGRAVAVTDRPISLQPIKEALAHEYLLDINVLLAAVWAQHLGP